jgi:hypothetical protein
MLSRLSPSVLRDRYASFRHDPFCCYVGGRPMPPDFLPWLFPTSRVCLSAAWFAAFGPEY